MYVLGLSSSPRIKGNSDYLLSLFLQQAEKRGFETKTIHTAKTNYEPCIGCGYCEKTGFCSIKDSLSNDIFSLIRKADMIVLATPVYFYGIPARMKAIIDRTQTLWSRKYRLGINDPKASYRKAILLSSGASSGHSLFEGIKLTSKYFFDALGADYVGDVCCSGLEERDALKSMIEHNDIENDREIEQSINKDKDKDNKEQQKRKLDAEKIRSNIEQLAEKFLAPLQNKKRIMFACRENAGRSQMSAAFAIQISNNNFDIFSAGSQPALNVNPVAVAAMAENGIDIAFNKPCSIEDALKGVGGKVDVIVTMGCGEECPFIPGCKIINWDLPDPHNQSIEEVRKIRDEILNNVKALFKNSLFQ